LIEFFQKFKKSSNSRNLNYLYEQLGVDSSWGSLTGSSAKEREEVLAKYTTGSLYETAAVDIKTVRRYVFTESIRQGFALRVCGV
jgi:hypothetical protein